MVREADRHRADRVSLVVVVGIDNRDREPSPLFDHELSHANELVGRERQLRGRLRADRTIAVKPGVMHAHVDQTLEPLHGKHGVDVGTAEARGHSGDEAGVEAELESAKRPVEYLAVATADVAGCRIPFDAHQRRGVAERLQPTGDLGRDQLAVGEDLEIAVGMSRQQVEQPRVEERLTPEQPEEDVAVGLRIADDRVEFLKRHHRSRRLHVDPAALALQVAGVDHGEMQKRWEDDALPSPGLEFLDRNQSLHAEIPAKLPEAVGRHGRQHVASHLGQDHKWMLEEGKRDSRRADRHGKCYSPWRRVSNLPNRGTRLVIAARGCGAWARADRAGSVRGEECRRGGCRHRLTPLLARPARARPDRPQPAG